MRREFASREKAIKEDQRKLDEMAAEMRRQNRDQKRSTRFETFCSIIPHLAEAAAKVGTAYYQQMQRPK
jgi:hypothetical protein